MATRASSLNLARLFVIPLFLLIAILQSTLVPLLRVADGLPNLPLLFVIAWLVLSTPEQGLIWSFAGGLALDLLSSAPFGTSTVALVGAVCAVELAIPKADRNSIFIPLLAVALATVVYQVTAIVILTFSGRPLFIGSFIGSNLLPTLGLNLLLTLPVFRLLGGSARRGQSGQGGQASTTGRMGLSLDEFQPIRKRARDRRK